MFRNPASFLKAFFGFFTAFGAVFLAIGLASASPRRTGSFSCWPSGWWG